MFHELKSKIPEMFHTHTFVYIPVREHFSFAKMIHPRVAYQEAD
jgi:hypothetical protein